MDSRQSRTMPDVLGDLLTGQYDCDEARHELGQVEAHPSFLSPAFRLVDSLQDGNQQDFLGNLRQCLLYCGCDLPISGALQELVERGSARFGLILEDYRVDALPCMMQGLEGMESLYQFTQNRKLHEVISDGRLYRYLGYNSYTSLAQKTINYYLANMEPCETFLACLPTGGGKSLSWQLPAMSHMWPGTVIVVVPTIALALDHARSSKELMKAVFGDKRIVMAYTPSDMEAVEKENAMLALEQGKLSILYISPEALMQERFKASVLNAAEEGYVSALVVDEVHLIVNWGRQFRPDFQLLPALRNQLEDLCPKDFRTILLSATLSPEDSEVLRKLFATERFTELRADGLREEPSYYTYRCDDEEERRRYICQLLDKVPRPVIIYVDEVLRCNEYLEMIKDWGYSRVGAFSGETGVATRKQLISQWNENKIDIMVATSAFGMGVDKSDVRTVITAYVPESVSRFYQEVGRAGRDGYASLSYWLYVKERDKRSIRSIMNNQVISVENLIERWHSMLKGEKVLGHPDWLIINTDAKPKRLEGRATGKLNATWNKSAIMMMYRAKLIDILDCEIIQGREDIYRIMVRMNDLGCLQDDELLFERIKPFRDRERENINNSMDAVAKLLENDECFAYSLSDAFMDSEFYHQLPFTCHGCPSCRKEGRGIIDAGEVDVDFRFSHSREKIYRGSRIPFDVSMRDFMNMRSEVALLRHSADDFTSMVAFMVRNQVNVIVAADFMATTLLPVLAQYDQYDYLLLTLPEAESLLDNDILDGSCALFYPKKGSEMERYRHFGIGFLNSREANRLIHIFYEDNVAYEDEKLVTEMIPTTWIDCVMEDG